MCGGTHPALEAGDAVAAHEAGHACLAEASNADELGDSNRVAAEAPMVVVHGLQGRRRLEALDGVENREQ